MPYSIVLELYSADKSEGGSAPITGEHVQAAFLNLLSQVDPQLAAEFHAGDRLRAYSLGILTPATQKENASRAGNHQQKETGRVLLRIACLDDRVYPALVRLVLAVGEQNTATVQAAAHEPDAYVQNLPRLEITLASKRFFLSRLLATPESGSYWSCYSEADELIKRASRDERRIRLRFASPTVFGQGSRDESLPAPGLVFPGLARRWNAIYGGKLMISEAEFSAWVHDSVVVSEYKIESAPMVVGHDPVSGTRWHTGCLGTVLYRIVGKPSVPFTYMVNLLADVAIFSGIGKKTSRGCGMVRRIT